MLRNVRQDVKHSKPGLTKEVRNTIPGLHRQAGRENETRKREKVSYSR